MIYSIRFHKFSIKSIASLLVDLFLDAWKFQYLFKFLVFWIFVDDTQKFEIIACTNRKYFLKLFLYTDLYPLILLNSYLF